MLAGFPVDKADTLGLAIFIKLDLVDQCIGPNVEVAGFAGRRN
jgi:hypothetical protein